MVETGVRDDLAGIDLEFGGGRPQGCTWDRAVCTASPTHQITVTRGEHSVKESYCQRHYVLTLRHLADVHLNDCGGEASLHASSYGPIEGRAEPTLAEEVAATRELYGNDSDAGMARLSQLIADWGARLGERDHQVLAVKAVLGAWMLESGETNEALKLLRSVLDGSNETLGRLHPFTIASLANLAAALRRSEQTLSAIGAYWALALRRRQLLGANHPDTLFARRRYATLLSKSGDTEAAIPELLALRSVLAHVEHPYQEGSAETLRALVGIYSAQERWIEVGELLSRALYLQAELFGRDHRIVAAARKQRWKVLQRALAEFEYSGSVFEQRPSLSSLALEFERYLQAEGLGAGGISRAETEFSFSYSAEGMHELAIEHAILSLDRVTGEPEGEAQKLDLQRMKALLHFLVERIPSPRAAGLLLQATLDDELTDGDAANLDLVEALRAEIAKTAARAWPASTGPENPRG